MKLKVVKGTLWDYLNQEDPVEGEGRKKWWGWGKVDYTIVWYDIVTIRDWSTGEERKGRRIQEFYYYK